MKPTSLRARSAETMTLEEIKKEIEKKTIKRNITKKILALIENLKGDIQGPLWSHIREKLEGMMNSADNLEDRSDEYDPAAHPIPDRTIWKSRGVVKTARAILSIEKMVENEEGYMQNLSKVEKELKELAERKQRISGS